MKVQNEFKTMKEQFQDQNLDKTLFLKKKRKRKQLFRSNLQNKSTHSEDTKDLIDYQKLINQNYPKNTYQKFLKNILKNEDIIIEESSNRFVKQQLQGNPKACYSERRSSFVATDINDPKDKEDGNVSNLTIPDENMEDLVSQDPVSQILYVEKESKKTLSLGQTSLKDIDPTLLSEEELQKLIKKKMKKLERYNSYISKNMPEKLMIKYKLKEEDLIKLRKVQRVLRGKLIKIKFFKALRFNQFLEHRKNFQLLKQSILRYQQKYPQRIRFAEEMKINYYFNQVKKFKLFKFFYNFFINCLQMDQNIFISKKGSKNLHERSQHPQGKDYYWTTDLNVELPIFLSESGPASQRPITMGEIFTQAIEQYADKNAYATLDPKTKQWQYMTFREARQNCEYISRALIRLGISRRSCVALLSYNRVEWNLSFWGALISDCVAFGIYMTNSPEECLHILNDSQSPIIVLENQEQYNKIVQVYQQLKYLKHIVTMEPVQETNNIKTITFDNLLLIGMEDKTHTIIEYQNRLKNLRAGQCAVLVYTSGTTGVSKGVMLSHDNMTTLLHNIREDTFKKDGRIISYLPASHIASLSVDVFLAFVYGACCYFALPDALKGNLAFYLQSVRPTVFLGVPRVYEKIMDKVLAEVQNSNLLKRKMFYWALHKSRQEIFNKFDNKDVSLQFKLADKILGGLRKKLGMDEVLEVFSGAAPLKTSVREFFMACGLYINNVYGLSETTGGITVLLPEQKHLYYPLSCGIPIPTSEVKVDSESNEVLCRGRTVFMGYLGREAQTINAIDKNRYFHSGDLGKFNETKNLFIIGRKKEIIVTAGGENVAPYPIENKIMSKLNKFVSWVVVIGDDRKFLTALIAIKNAHDATQVPSDEIEDEAQKYLDSKGIKVSKISELFIRRNQEKVGKLIQEAIEYANSKTVSNAAKVKSWILLNRDFSIPTNEMTPTLKLKRPQVEKNFKTEIDEVYMKPSL